MGAKADAGRFWRVNFSASWMAGDSSYLSKVFGVIGFCCHIYSNSSAVWTEFVAIYNTCTTT